VRLKSRAPVALVDILHREEPSVPVHPVERKLAAIFAADIAGYSRLMARDEVGTLARLKAFRTIIDKLIVSHRGRIFNTAGDSVVADFASAVDAVECAVAVQTAIATEDDAGRANEPMQLRIGVHIGDVMIDGGNLLGDGVNIAARLESLAEPGAVCVSAVVRDQVGNKLPVAFDDLGDQQLKNIGQPIRVYRVQAGSAAPQPAPALPLPDKPSIAVLPFQNMSGDPEQEYFADGMVEEIITALSRIRWFFVIARNSTFTYKGRAVDVKQVGRELGVRYVLEGSVRKSGNRIRVTAQLVEAATGNHVWAERYDRDLADIFAVQDEITERVVAAIEPELYAAEQVRSQSKPPDSLDAWECVIRALSCIGQGTRDENTEAEALCRRAIAIAPGYGRAHSLLAWALLRRLDWYGDIKTIGPEASAEARMALGLDERDPWAHLVHGVVLFRMRHQGEAERAFRRALDLNPNFALAHARLANQLAIQGMHQEAVDSAEHALRLSPRDRPVGTYASQAMANVHLAAGRYSECVTWARNVIENSPEWLPGHSVLTAALGLAEDLTAAAEARDTLLRLRPNYSLTWQIQNSPLTGELADRMREGLRKAGVPEG
jgi:TolB-like protein/Tfp pilus assembly protein PilF